jgi:hypothetical protein
MKCWKETWEDSDECGVFVVCQGEFKIYENVFNTRTV